MNTGAARENQDDSPPPVPVLPLSRYRLYFKPQGPLRLPEYAGSAWRGAFGHALKQAVCVTRMKNCIECMLYRTCPYPYIFATPPPADADKMRKYTDVPHPYVIHMLATQREDEYGLGLSVFGRANQHLGYFIHALTKAAAEGVGRTAFTLLRVEQANNTIPDTWREIYLPGGALMADAPTPASLPPLPAAMRLHFHSPLRLRRQAHYVDATSFCFADLFGSLLRRISMLTYFHTETPLETDFAGLKAQARALDFSHTELRWQDWTRYSARQKTTMEMGGLIGTATLETQNLQAFWPYLWLGQWTHAGKGTVMGLGQYRIEMLASLPNRTTTQTTPIIQAM